MEIAEQKQVVTFFLNEEEYGVDILGVHEIKRMREINITQVPRAPEFVEGVINLRGDVIPIIDLRTRFGMAKKEKDKETRIIVVYMNEKYIGFLVDRVNEVLTFGKEDIDDPPEEVIQIDSYFIEGIGKHDQRLVILLDTEKVLNSQEKETLASMVE